MAQRPAAARAASAALLAAGLLGAQGWWVVKRRLPTCPNLDASGVEGDRGPLVVLGVAGDSCSTGPGLADPAHIWARVAARRVAADLGCRIEVRSVAVGGARVGDVVRHQIAPLRGVAPDVVAVVAGGNDAMRGTPGRRLRAEATAMVDALASLGCPVLVSGLGWLGSLPRVPPPLAWLLGARSRRVHRALSSAARRRRNVTFVDTTLGDARFRAGGRALFADDLFHASAEGHQIWADLATASLSAAVSAVLAGRSPAEAAASAARARDEVEAGIPHDRSDEMSTASSTGLSTGVPGRPSTA